MEVDVKSRVFLKRTEVNNLKSSLAEIESDRRSETISISPCVNTPWDLLNGWHIHLYTCIYTPGTRSQLH